MSNQYKFTFKKDDIFVEFNTTDKETLSRQFQIWVTCASVYTYQHKRQLEDEKDTQQQIEQQKAKPIEQVEFTTYGNESITSLENTNEDKKITLNDLQNQPTQEIFEQLKNEFETIEDKRQEIIETVVQAGEISDNLDNLYDKDKISSTFDSFRETLEDNDEFSNKTSDFDKILELSMNNATTEIEIKKDDRFLKILNVKNVSNKLEYLIVTAYYLSEFEKLDKFTLKLINAKLMQNIQEAVDHNILQEAIDKNLVEALPSLPNISNSAEYRLTTAGEEAFLNGTKL